MPLIVDKSHFLDRYNERRVQPCTHRHFDIDNCMTNPLLVRYASYDLRVTIADHLYNKAGGIAHRIIFGESSYQMRTSIIDDALKKRLWLLSVARHRMSPLIEG